MTRIHPAPPPAGATLRRPPGRETRAVTFRREAVHEETRTVELAFSSEEPVERWWGVEILGHDQGEVDLIRMEAGRAPLLVDHDPTDQVGVVESVDIGADRVGRAVVRFGRSARAEEIFRDILDGIRGNTSVGYAIDELRLESEADGIPTYRATRWTPLEISIVSVPADPSVGVDRAAGDTPSPTISRRADMAEENQTEENTAAGDNDGDEGRANQQAQQRQQPQAPQARQATVGQDNERVRASEILAIGQRFNMVAEAAEAIRSGIGVQAFQAQVLERQGGESRPLRTGTPELGMSEREARNYSLLRAVRAAASNDWSRAGFEREASQAIAQRIGRDARGFFVPYEVLGTRAELATGTTAGGGALVATQLQAGSFIELLRNRMMVTRLGAQMMSGLVGNVDIPKQTGGATAYWLGESDDVTESEQAFGNVTLSPKTVAAKSKFTRRLLLQSTPDVEMIVRNDLINTLALAIDLAAISGSGSANQPKGILNTTGIGLVAIGADGGAPTFDHVVALESEVAVDNADIGNLAYLTNAKVRGVLKRTKKDAGSGEFVWTNQAGEAGMGELNGYLAAVSNQVPSNLTKANGTNLSAMIYGNWADLLIGEWGILDLQVDPYSSADDGGTIVRAFQDVDIATRHAESFAAIKDAVTG